MNPPILVISAGHGEKNDGSFDQGAYNPIDKTHEHALNVRVRDYCIKELQKYNCIVISDKGLLGKAHDPNWSAITADYKRRNFKPALLIDIHHDSYNAKKAGFGILPRTVFKRRITDLCGKISIEYGKRGLPTKPSYQDVRGLGLLRVLAYPTAIWECNATFAVDDLTLQARGIAIAQGIVKWLSIPLRTPDNPAAPRDTIYKVRVFLGLKGEGGQDKEYVSALIAWKKAHKYYPSAVLAPWILEAMGIK